jgi:hypothetical protein
MSILEQFGITIVLGLLQLIIKDPARAAALKNQLLGIAGDIANVYGYALMPPAAAPIAATKRTIVSA